MFITFEGCEGSGKSTQIGLINTYLESKGLKVIQTREPGGTLIADKIRSLLVRKDPQESLANITELLLYNAARAQHLKEVIIPSLKLGKIVLCDRYYDSTVAYQAYGRGFERSTLENLHALVVGALEEYTQPSLTFLIDIPTELGLVRAQKRELGQENPRDREDRFEQEELDFHKRVRQGYLELAGENSERIVTLDGTQPVQAIHEQIVKILKDFKN